MNSLHSITLDDYGDENCPECGGELWMDDNGVIYCRDCGWQEEDDDY